MGSAWCCLGGIAEDLEERLVYFVVVVLPPLVSCKEVMIYVFTILRRHEIVCTRGL